MLTWRGWLDVFTWVCIALSWALNWRTHVLVRRFQSRCRGMKLR